MPDPRDAGYTQPSPIGSPIFLPETKGRAFVLFTSYRGMLQLAEEMELFLAEKMNLLVQGQGVPRKTARTIEDHSAECPFWHRQFLDGRRCAWRCAFQCHDYSVAVCRSGSSTDEAKLELVEARGGDAFTEYSLPEAVLKLARVLVD